jgi:hypothetical protein
VNVLRNVGVHLGTPWIKVNEATTHLLDQAAKSLGADINDPRGTFGLFSFNVLFLGLDEDYTGNMIHMLLFTGLFLTAWFVPISKTNVRWYMIAVAGCFLLFCSIIRFQPWNSRFQLALFILFSPAAGYLMEKFWKPWILSFFVVMLFVLAIPGMILNNQHPWVGRNNIWNTPKEAQYFYKQSDRLSYYLTSSSYLKTTECKDIGLLIGEDTWEYPWLAYLAGSGTRIEHVLVNNQSARLGYPLGAFDPCVVIASSPPESILKVGQGIYVPVLHPILGEEKITAYKKVF